jgi:hypothetical protein
MAINPHVPTPVNPGEPVTAQAWNVFVNAIIAISNYLDSTEASSLQVTVTNPQAIPEDTRVTATRDDGGVFAAVAPVPPGTTWVFTGLRAGAYSIRVEAAGFEPTVEQITAPVTDPVSITLTPSGAFMPPLFGSTLQAALQELKNRNIAVERILDVAGRDVPPGNPPAEFRESPVLMQFPLAGVAVPPAGRANLVVAAALDVEPAIEVPSLAGLSLSEAQKALESIGLVLGKVVTKQTTLPQ